MADQLTQARDDLLGQRQAERLRIEQHYAGQAREHAARHGLSLTCQNKPRDLHGTCIGIGPQSKSPARGIEGGRINNGLGCLCECHDDEAREMEATD